MSLDDYAVSYNVGFCWALRLSQVLAFTGQLLKQGLDWDWTGTGLELDWSNLANNCRLMQARAYSDEN